MKKGDTINFKKNKGVQEGKVLMVLSSGKIRVLLPDGKKKVIVRPEEVIKDKPDNKPDKPKGKQAAKKAPAKDKPAGKKPDKPKAKLKSQDKPKKPTKSKPTKATNKALEKQLEGELTRSILRDLWNDLDKVVQGVARSYGLILDVGGITYEEQTFSIPIKGRTHSAPTVFMTDYEKIREKDFPDIGTTIIIGEKEYTVTGFNRKSQNVNLDRKGQIYAIPLDQFKEVVCD